MQKFIAHLVVEKKVNRAPLFLRVEDEMKTLYLDENRDQKNRKGIWMRNILTLPYPVLYGLWEKAFDSLLARTEKEASGADIYLNLHAIYYHHYTVEYVSLLSLQKLREFKPDVIITLIDDIYDIHNRLREKGEIFDSTIGGSSDPDGAIMELLRILD